MITLSMTRLFLTGALSTGLLLARPARAQSDPPQPSAAVREESNLPIRSLRVANLLLTGFASSASLTAVAFFNPATDNMTASEYTAFMHSQLRVATIVMPAVNLLALGTYVPLLLHERHEPLRAPFLLTAASALLFVTATTLAIVTEAPANAAFIDASAANPPSNWAQLRTSWNTMQPVKMGFQLGASLTALAAMVFAKD